MKVSRRTFHRLAVGTVATAVGGWSTSLLWSQTPSGGPLRMPTEKEIRTHTPGYWQLVDLLNDYRRRQKLPTIAFSPQLTYVASMHVRDLAQQKPHVEYGSLHSWSSSDRWRGGAYRATEKETWPIMWDKPKELSGYEGYGFEIAAADVVDMPEALRLWQASTRHNDVILNRGVWDNPRWQWRAVGAVFFQGFACAWFGDKPDPLRG